MMTSRSLSLLFSGLGLIIQGAGSAALGRMWHPGPYRRVDREGGGPGDRPGRRREAVPSRVPERAR